MTVTPSAPSRVPLGAGGVIQRMKILDLDIDSIHADPANVRRHPERNLETIKASLSRFGQQKPIVVDASGIVRAGNGTLEAAKALGWTKIKAVRTDLAGSEATAYAIADNRTAELAEWDDTALAETLRSLQSEDFDLAAVGYDAGEVDRLIEQLAGEIVPDFQPASIEDQGRLDQKAPVTCPECGHEFSP